MPYTEQEEVTAHTDQLSERKAAPKYMNNKLCRHFISLQGCLEILEMISCVVAIACSFLNMQWLTEAGGGFVSFTLIVCLPFILFLFFAHLSLDWSTKWQLIEWIGYIVSLLLLIISTGVTIRACGMQFIEQPSSNQRILLENAHIEGTAVFLVLAVILFLVHTVILTRHRISKR